VGGIIQFISDPETEHSFKVLYLLKRILESSGSARTPNFPLPLELQGAAECCIYPVTSPALFGKDLSNRCVPTKRILVTFGHIMEKKSSSFYRTKRDIEFLRTQERFIIFAFSKYSLKHNN
jgi:hypothetical protein